MLRLRWAGAIIAMGTIVFACSGEDGKDGAVGPPGAKGQKGATGETGAKGAQGKTGPEGKQGPPGEPDDSGAAGAGSTGLLTTSCLSPCHGFNGIVEQWKTSRHYATYISNLGGDEVDTWTGATACGNCHAVDGIEQRVAGNVTHAGTTGPTDLAHGQIGYLNSISGTVSESVYAGQATVAVVDCSTCHDTSDANDPHVTGKDYEPGSFPLRVPTGKSDQAVIERSSAVGTSDGTPAGDFGVGNACVWCHKSRKDVTNYVLATNNIGSAYWGPHEGPAADVYSGAGGYQYDKSYGNSSHQNFSDGCVHCHMPSGDTNQGVGNHSFYAQLSVCNECHANPPNFDIVGGQSKVKVWLQRLRVSLNDLQLLSLDGTSALDAPTLAKDDFAADQARIKTGVPGDVAGALYNYFVIARASALGVHNPRYVGQLLYDSIEATGGDLSGIVRPP
jgi:hypothetical protein